MPLSELEILKSVTRLPIVTVHVGALHVTAFFSDLRHEDDLVSKNPLLTDESAPRLGALERRVEDCGASGGEWVRVGPSSWLCCAQGRKY